MAFGHATTPADAARSGALAPALAVLISARPAGMSLRVSPTLHAQGLPSFVIDPTADASGRRPPVLREHPAACIGFVDAPDGVAQGRELGLGLLVGLGSDSRGAALLGAGADLVVGTPAELCAGAFYEAYARRFETLPDPLAQRDRWHAHLAGADGWGVLVDARALARRRDDAAALATLARLPARVPVALIGGSEVRNQARAFGLDRADALAHDALTLAPAALLDAARHHVEAAAVRLCTLARELGLPAPRDDGVGLRLHLPRLAPPERAPLRRALVRALAPLAGIEWELDAHGLDLRPVVSWPARERLAVLRAWWSHRAAAHRVLILSATPRYEPWLRALQAQDAGVIIAAAPTPTAATWRTGRLPDIARLLGAWTA